MNYYSISEAAKKLGVSTSTMRRWHKSGQLVPEIVLLSAYRRYSEKQLEDYKQKGSLATGKK